MKTQRRTFISYSRSNKEFVVRLARELRAEGFPVWLDILDIPAGSRWDREVEKALKESDIFMIILTRASAESENVLDEIGYAIDHRKRIMPVLMEKCDIPLRLTRFQYVDFTNKNFDEGIDAAKDLLKSLSEQPTVPRKDGIDIPQPKDQLETGEKAKSKTEAVGQTEEHTDRIPVETHEKGLAGQKKDEISVVKVKAEPDQKVQEKVKPVEASAVKESIPAQKNPLSKGMMYGIGVVGLLLMLSFVFNAFVKNGNPNASTPPSNSTREPVGTKLVTSEPAIPIKPIPTHTAVVLTSIPTDILPKLDAGSTMPGQDGMTLLYVPPGKFTMGSNQDGNDEKPSHLVELSAFWIDQTEVTNEMYQKCVETQTCKKPSTTTYYIDPRYAKYPVVFVSWQDAVKYCTYAGRRLPTEAEWEKAARGEDERIYPWGNQAPGTGKELLNFRTSVGGTTAVNSYPKGVSYYGAVDMAGNVLEWVNDRFVSTYYQNSPSLDPTGPDSSGTRVLRGGSWQSDSNAVTTYRREFRNPEAASGTIGFRCALSADALP
jgi:formylglycine-generating enzyme required for sulfatase activity